MAGIFGFVLSSLASILLLRENIRERTARLHSQAQLTAIQGQLAGQKRNLEEKLEANANFNKTPGVKPIDPKFGTEPIVEEISRLRSQLDALQDPQKALLDA